MISIGGFGHSGNTALLDMLIESADVCPIAYGYSESAIIRSKWGFRGILSNLDENEEFIPWNLIEDCLLGVQREEHNEHNPPTRHDFVRNDRVKKLLGVDYEKHVTSMLNKFREENNVLSKYEILDLLKCFLFSVQELAIRKSGNEQAIPIIRNDPAAAGISMLKFSTFDIHLITYRDVFDMMYDWIMFYDHPNNQEGAYLFLKQYKRKINNFIKSINALPDDVSVKIKAVSFEKLIQDQKTRDLVFDICKIKAPKKYTQFNPGLSAKNIGIGLGLNESAYNIAMTDCQTIHDKLINFLDDSSLLILP